VTQPVLPFEPSDSTRLDEVVIHCDGGSRGNPGPAAIGAVITDPSTEPPAVLATVSETIGVATNNVAEYQACIAGLCAAAPYRARLVRVRADSLLMIRQLRGEYRVKQAHLKPLHAEALRLLQSYDEVDLQHVRREANVDADALVNAALDAMPAP
jgi:ribonuclease HI